MLGMLVKYVSNECFTKINEGGGGGEGDDALGNIILMQLVNQLVFVTAQWVHEAGQGL